MKWENMTVNEFKNRYISPPAKSKYNNRKAVIDGIKFDSKKESQRYCELVVLQKAKQIKELQLQVPYVLIPKSKYGRAIKYIADFVYYDCKLNKTVIEDSKGVKTPVYKLKKRLMAELGHEIVET